MPKEERGEETPITLGTVLLKYNLPDFLTENALVLFDRRESLYLREALRLSRDKLVGPALGILTHQEQVVVSSRRADGRRRSESEKRKIREQYEGERQALLVNGPGRVLALIIGNSGRESRWTKKGLVGVDSNLVEPLQEECAWWGWVYGKVQKGLDPDKLYIGNTGIILHAAFLMRFRAGRRLIAGDELNSFIEEMTPLIPESQQNGELTSLLREIADYRPK